MQGTFFKLLFWIDVLLLEKCWLRTWQKELRRLFSKESSLTIYTNHRKMHLFAISGNKVSVAWKEKQFLIVTYISSCKKVDWHLARRIATGFFRNLGLNFEKNQSCMHFLALSVHENSHARTFTEDTKIEELFASKKLSIGPLKVEGMIAVESSARKWDCILWKFEI